MGGDISSSEMFEDDAGQMPDIYGIQLDQIPCLSNAIAFRLTYGIGSIKRSSMKRDTFLKGS